MGASNVAAALAFWGPRLGRRHASRVALIVMANVAKDNDPVKSYWAGAEPIANALGLLGTDRERMKRVGEVLAPLRRAGAITVTQRPAAGHRNTRYELHLDGPSRSGVTPDREGQPEPVMVRRNDASRSGVTPTTVRRNDASRSGVTPDQRRSEEQEGATEENIFRYETSAQRTAEVVA